MDDGYDPMVYENTLGNWGKMVSMLLIYYFFMGCHWWCNYEFGIADAVTSTTYQLCVFAFALCVIGTMLFLGSGINRKKITHEFY